ncbi:MAG: hypothetical protein PVJ78_12195 [Gammaproteobacteria bacterium]|jgi:hypothetical protein
MLSNLEKISIFWDESSLYVLVYGAYALLVCGIVLIFEIRLHRGAGEGVAGLAIANAAVAILAILLFTASMLASGWYANYFGGEIGAFFATLAITSLVIYFAKTWLIGHYGLQYATPWLPGVTVSALLIAPYTLVSIFIYLLASGMRN